MLSARSFRFWYILFLLSLCPTINVVSFYFFLDKRLICECWYFCSMQCNFIFLFISWIMFWRQDLSIFWNIFKFLYNWVLEQHGVLLIRQVVTYTQVLSMCMCQVPLLILLYSLAPQFPYYYFLSTWFFKDSDKFACVSNYNWNLMFLLVFPSGFPLHILIYYCHRKFMMHTHVGLYQSANKSDSLSHLIFFSPCILVCSILILLSCIS